MTQCHRKYELVGDQSLEAVVAVRSGENQTLQGPRLLSPAGWERNAAIAKRAGGQYVAVFVQSPTHHSHNNPFVTISNKVWGMFFSKEVCPLVFIVLTMFLHAYEYVTPWVLRLHISVFPEVILSTTGCICQLHSLRSAPGLLLGSPLVKAIYYI